MALVPDFEGCHMPPVHAFGTVAGAFSLIFSTYNLPCTQRQNVKIDGNIREGITVYEVLRHLPEFTD